jgi:PLP dependent protein
VADLTAERVRANLAEVRERLSAAAPGREVEVVAATKYVTADQLPVLAEGGITVVGENRAQDLAAKHAAHGDLFTWDFIGHLQSRKVKDVAPLVRRIHSVGSDSAVRRLNALDRPPEVLLEVNVAREEGKSGIAPEELDGYLEACAAPVVGLMTMPPLAERPEDSRRWFAALRELAAARGLEHLSMGTTQDFEVAAQEGATIVRVGSVLVR